MKLEALRRQFRGAECIGTNNGTTTTETCCDRGRGDASGGHPGQAEGAPVKLGDIREALALDGLGTEPNCVCARARGDRKSRGPWHESCPMHSEASEKSVRVGIDFGTGAVTAIAVVHSGDYESLEALRDAAALDGLEAVGSETPNCATCGKHVKFPFHLINGSLYCSTDCSPPIGPGDVLSVFSGPGAFGSGGGSAEGSAGAEPGTFSGTTFGGGGAPGPEAWDPEWISREAERGMRMSRPMPGIRGVDYAERRVGDMVAAEAFALEEKTAEIAERLAGPIGTFARTMRSVEDAMAESLSGPFRKLAEGLDEMARADHDEKALRPSRRYVGKAVVSPNTESYHRPLALPRRT